MGGVTQKQGTAEGKHPKPVICALTTKYWGNGDHRDAVTEGHGRVAEGPSTPRQKQNRRPPTAAPPPPPTNFIGRRRHVGEV